MTTQQATLRPFQTGVGAGARPITFEQAALLFTPDEIAKGECRGEIETRGPWGLLVSYKAIATWQDLTGEYHEYADRSLTIYGKRKLSHVHQSGYELEGRVSVGGKSYRGFTSSALFELPDGKLISAAVIHVCKPKS